MAYSKAFADNFRNIDWSDFKPSPNRSRVVGDRAAFHVMSDINPYRSVVTGEVIGGRRQHREHLKVHGLIEVGNERPKGNRLPVMPPAGPEIAMEMKKRGIIG